MSTLSLESLLEKWEAPKTFIKNISDWDEDNSNFPIEVEGLQGSLKGFLTSLTALKRTQIQIRSFQYSTTGRYSQEKQKLKSSSSACDFVLVVQNEKDAADLYTDIDTTLGDGIGCEIYILPWWGIIPYRQAALGSSAFGERSGILARLAQQNRVITNDLKPRFFIITLRSLLTPTVPPKSLTEKIFSIYKGQEIDGVKLAEKLALLGYIRVPKVSAKGEFALRGEVLDIYLAGEKNPFRITFDFDTIESIKTFDAELQTTTIELSKKHITNILIYPMKEVIWNSELVDKLENVLQKENKLTLTETAEKAKVKLLSDLREKGESEGEELFYGQLWDKTYSVIDYIAEDTTVIFFDFDRLKNSREMFDKEYEGMYRKEVQSFPVLPPSYMLLKFDEEILRHKRRVLYRTIHTYAEETVENQDESSKSSSAKIETLCENKFNFTVDQNSSFFGNINYLKERLESLFNDGWNIFIYAEGENQALRIAEILKDFENLIVLPYSISQGFGIPEIKTLVIQENEIFGRRKHHPQSLKKTKSQAIDTFVDLQPGDFVVHVNYGIGLFKGIQRMKAMGNERDYIKLEYADEEYAFVPIEQVNMIQRYIGNEGNAPRLDRIGSKSWENRKNKVKKSVEDLAQHLIDLYSRRKASRGFPFPKDTEWQLAFEASFPYEDTADQVTVSREIKEDMEKPVPMDRLVCGDVGYGKTEIAMRAAFKAVMGGKQVAFLAPTTILAEQHYENCVERFANFPVKIAHMSRFVSPKEQKKILEKLKEGQIDLLVGTHRIIQKDVVFKDLGLMIIDEEQRFGVKDKERLKTLKNNIDSLAMSATPIPRTLHMSLLKIRDMSLLTTPPQTRKPIETVISEFNDEKIARAIRAEVERGGQVFYLHNRVESLEETRRKIEKLVPEMMVDVAHGQMSADELDDIFRRFKLGGFHILVATTIIENGIDIPNVNTIIIDRADMYGVSQLYQLRGRVGRSDKKAYAYLFYPENKALSEVAMKRLQVISDFTELGSGFKIAMKDMEIRGAGNLLGKDQSGDVYSVGFDLYLRLLNEAVERLMNSENFEAQSEVLLELEYTGFIPDSYVTNPQIKMEIYKKIAAVSTKEELGRVYTELEDRFGPIPDEVYSLLSLSEIRVIAKQLKIASLKEKMGVLTVEFAKMQDIKVDKVLRLIKESAGRVTLSPKLPTAILLNTGKIGLKEKSDFIRDMLERIA